MNINPRSDPVVAAFTEGVKSRLGTHLRQLRLFDSRARGDAKDESDYDMLVIVDQRTPEIRSRILDLETEIIDRYEALVTSIIRSEEEWKQSQEYPLAKNIEREGMRL